MKRKVWLWATCLLPATALGQDAGALVGTVDGYFLPSANIEFRSRSPVTSADEKGDGYGVKALLHLNDYLMATGEYQSVSYDDIPDSDRTDYRLGVGWGGASGTGLFGEFVSTELGDGFGAHARAAGTMGERLALYGQAGYVQVEDDERFAGFEFAVGGAYGILDMLGVFADYRVTNLEGSVSQAEFKFRDIRVGVRYTFGAEPSMPAEVEPDIGVEPVEDGGEAPAEEPTDEPAVEEPVE